MNVRRHLAWGAFAIVVLGCSVPDEGSGEREAPRAAARSVLILSVDTLRYDALGFTGASVETPNLDRLAANGVSFSNAIAPMPRTTPSLGSLLTGLWPQHHGSREVGDPIRDDVGTLAQRLGDEGFVSLGVSINDSAGPRQGIARGFDDFVDYREVREGYGDRLYQAESPAPPDAAGWAQATTEQTLNLVDRNALGPDVPYLLWVFYFDPHFVYRPPSPWQDEVEAEACWELYRSFENRRHLGGEIFADIGGVASAALPACERLYRAEVAYFDAQVGTLLQGLDDRGLLEETLIVFTSDHGENFGEGGLFFEHGENAHEAGLRIPLVFSGPGVAAGRVDPTAVSLVDVVPTVLGWLGLEPGPVLDGEDLGERIGKGPAPAPAADRIVFAESASALWNQAREPLVTGRLGGRVCVNGGDWTLCREGDEETVFDRRTDPGLREPIGSPERAPVAELRSALDRWPAESARQRVARTVRFKLVQFPVLAGGYRSELYDLRREGEGVDVSATYPRVVEVLEKALVDWAAGIPSRIQRSEDPEREAVLRNLGYVE